MNELTTTTENQLLLPLPDGVRFTSRRLTMPENLSFAAWMDVGRFLLKSGDSLDFWRADHIARGRKQFGDEKVKEALRQLDFENADFKRAQLLTSIELRDPDLSPEHHFVLAKAKLDDVSRDMWAQLAKKESLSAAELQESIKKGTVSRIERDDGSGAAGVATWRGLAMQFDLLRRQIGDGWNEWNASQIGEVLESITRIANFVNALRVRSLELGRLPKPQQ